MALRLPLLLLLASCMAAAVTPTFASPGSAQCAQLKATGVLGPGAPVTCSQLQVVRFAYIDFDHQRHDDGEIMVMAAVAPQVATIFKLLLAQRVPLARARLMDHYQGDDAASMADNNTSAFNHRPITGGSAPSLHAYGLAIDLNPLQNPYLRRNDKGVIEVSPAAGKDYVKRLPMRPGMVDAQIAAIFAAHGFPIWGGDWREPIDYQHFQVSRKMAERLAKLPLKQAQATFENSIGVYRRCMVGKASTPATRKICALDK
ncbi:M15 family metallopeptidase [Glaciimonas sp. GG7]